jgi:uncharacterized integral membrane protein
LAATTRRTRISAFWVALVVSLLVLVLLIVFILQNSKHTIVSYFGAHANLPLGVALLIAAVIGGLVVAFAGVARILQLRTKTRRAHRETTRALHNEVARTASAPAPTATPNTEPR